MTYHIFIGYLQEACTGCEHLSKEPTPLHPSPSLLSHKPVETYYFNTCIFQSAISEDCSGAE